ncbi:MAG: hypothetical protein EOO28_11835 [Comamonadaceae bacterium]|nr:MAG: hypothetical protein EOO28_11835 [Comamonadaceae bacterium]
MLNKFARPTAVTAAILVLAACSDGDDAPTPVAPPALTVAPTPVAPPALTVTGAAYKGPLSSASICVYKLDNAAEGKKGALVAAQTGSTPSVASGCVVTGNDGNYSLVLPADTSGELVIESKGGTYCSDESLYNGSTCAGGGTPVPMGSSVLRTVLAAPAGGVIASAPLSILTTAAASGTGTLSVSAFTSAFNAVAANVGVTGATPSTAPTASAVSATLQALSNYLGGDASILADVVAGIANGAIKAVGGTVQTTTALTCSALEASDTASAYALRSCVPAGDGTFTRITYEFRSTLLNGQAEERYIYATKGYPDATCSGPGTTTESIPYTIASSGSATLALSASANAAVSQSGSATKLAMTVTPSTLFGNSTTTTINHLFCRTVAAGAGCTGGFKGYLASTKSPVKNGSLSRIDGSSEVVASYCD